jgi:hypothetical protein
MRYRLNNEGATAMTHAHQTAPTRFVEANGIRFAYLFQYAKDSCAEVLRFTASVGRVA